MATGDRDRDRDRELLLSVVTEKNGRSKSILHVLDPQPHLHSSHKAIANAVRSWASVKFMTGCVILLPMAITFYIMWGVSFILWMVSSLVSITNHLGINIFD
ncbi:hypothetical protein MLD38_034416 [Melastoma candidum]|uniref:Uncharacterized protein n=1 Tax=Melastoma candidum TaxID=119954 RepID=A0ACB9MC70_9MYRT|nr:hypothetical protein MLD38_034416 [Melastoma candidum]